MDKIKTIVRKEWAEVFKNRMVIFTVAFLPLLMTAIPLGVIFGTRGSVSSTSASSASGALPTELTEDICPPGASSGECMQVFLVTQFMLMFMMVPIIIPVTIAAYSIVGEKTNRSLEPLLATPITTVEFMIGKCLAAVVPAVGATFAAFGIFVFGSWIIAGNKTLLAAILEPRWLIAIFIVGPLLAIMAVSFALMVSSRVNDPRVAEQVSMVVIVPVLAGFFGQIAGLFILNQRIITYVALVMCVVDAVLLYLATLVFQREQILTRWK